MRYLSIVLVLGLFLCGCIVTKVHTMPVQTFSVPYDQVWDSVIVYLDKEKEPIVLADKEKGVISTDWVNMQKVFATKRYRYDIQVTEVGENQVQVGIASPQESYTMGDWEEMLPHEIRAHRMFRAIARRLRSISTVSRKVSYRPFNKRQRGLVRDIP